MNQMSYSRFSAPNDSGPGQLRWASYILYSNSAIPPSKESPDNAFYDLFSAGNHTIEPGKTESVCTGIGFILPRYIFAWISGAKGLFANGVDMEPTIVSPDSAGPTKVVLRNTGSKPFEIKAGEPIGRVVFTRILNQRAIFQGNRNF